MKTIVIIILASVFVSTLSQAQSAATESCASSKETCGPNNTKSGEAKSVSKLMMEFIKLQSLARANNIIAQKVDYSNKIGGLELTQSEEDESLLAMKGEIDGLKKYFDQEVKAPSYQNKAQFVRDLKVDIEALKKMIARN